MFIPISRGPNFKCALFFKNVQQNGRFITPPPANCCLPDAATLPILSRQTSILLGPRESVGEAYIGQQDHVRRRPPLVCDNRLTKRSVIKSGGAWLSVPNVCILPDCELPTMLRSLRECIRDLLRALCAACVPQCRKRCAPRVHSGKECAMLVKQSARSPRMRTQSNP